jgi:hypothetical protein
MGTWMTHSRKWGGNNLAYTGEMGERVQGEKYGRRLG